MNHRLFPGTRGRARSGFALVVTISLLVLLTVLAVGLLGLSTVSLRAAGESAAEARARANARLALQLAIGQLQRATGPDDRITAPAELLGGETPSHPDWRGVWRSNATTPRAYEADRADFFEEWLVTATTATPPGIDAARQAVAESAVLSRDEDGREVRVPLAEVAENGRIAWWTDDESMKARADLPSEAPRHAGDDLLVMHAAPRKAPEVVAGVEGFEVTAETAAKLVSNRQLPLAASAWPDRAGRHFTAHSRSVVANVREGGLRQDLSILFDQPAERITGFGQWRGQSALQSRDAYLYGPAGAALGARWNQLHAYHNLHRDVSLNRGESRIEPRSALIDWRDADAQRSFGDDMGGFRFPRVAKIIYVFSYSAAPNPQATGTRDALALQLVTDIFVTLWNPFDTRILFPANTTFFAKFSRGLPLRFDWRVNGVNRGSVGLHQMSSPTSGAFLSQSPFYLPGQGRQFTMAPGETVVFSLRNSSGLVFDGVPQPDFRPGAFFDHGLRIDHLLGSNQRLTGGVNDRISAGVRPAEDGVAFNIGGVPTSQYVDFWILDTNRRWPYYEHRGEIIARADTPFIQRMPGVDSRDVPEISLGDVSGGRKQPFAAFVMEMKSATDSVNPVPAFLTSGISRLSSRLGSDPGQFANERMEYRLEPVTGFDSDLVQVSLPGHPAGPNRGFIGSGRTPGSGQTHMLAASIPSLPPTSLSQYRHAGTGDGAPTLRATHWGFISTPNPPFADQAIGNSYAHPLVPPQVAASGTLLDHRYLGNEALWDRFFLSSAAAWSSQRLGPARSMSQGLRDFFEGRGQLLNRRVSPWLGGEDAEQVHRRYFSGNHDGTLRPDAYRKIAANLMIEGGFNINSTSVDAWQAFLSSTRGASLSLAPLGAGGTPQTLTATGTAFSRTDTVLAGSVDENPGDVLTHYAGYRELDDEQVRALAEAVVEQVKRRGPFLNLGEFVNRRLSREDTDLALSGALQAAIDASGLNDAVAAAAMEGSARPVGARLPFPDAGTLSTAAGSAGWLMQGDVLDPLGPFIMARGDTFRIRAYGEATDPSGRVLARAWCEAVVQRTPAYLDPADAPEIHPPSRPINRTFGRRYEVVSFRWLDGPEA